MEGLTPGGNPAFPLLGREGDTPEPAAGLAVDGHADAAPGPAGTAPVTAPVTQAPTPADTREESGEDGAEGGCEGDAPDPAVDPAVDRTDPAPDGAEVADSSNGAPPPGSDGGIERNAGGCEEPHSDEPELWNIDGTEIDLNAKYKVLAPAIEHHSAVPGYR
jgi:hypothetical protein